MGGYFLKNHGARKLRFKIQGGLPQESRCEKVEVQDSGGDFRVRESYRGARALPQESGGDKVEVAGASRMGGARLKN